MRPHLKGKEFPLVHVFISYAHEDFAFMELLQNKLEKTLLYRVRTDTGGKPLTPTIHSDISSNLNWAHVIVPVLTQSWLQSAECRDELVRANERRKNIILFRHESLKDEKAIPFYLRETAYVKWDNDREHLESAVLELLEKLKTVQVARWKFECYEKIRKLGDYVQDSTLTPEWKASLARRVINTTEGQVSKTLTSSDCSFNISFEHTYLGLAEPLFRTANSIIAICIAEISTFWTNPDFKIQASEYLGKQKGLARSIRRLFVFKSADEANSYKNILQAHFTRYGEDPKCGVFFCSSESYARLRARWDYGAAAKAEAEDFGILDFEDGSPVHAVLTSKEFRLREFQLDTDDDVDGITDKIVVEQFERLCLLKDGEVDETTRVARWSPKFYDDEQQFADVLKRTFGDRVGSVSHYVCLNPSGDLKDFEDYLYKLASQFYTERETLRVTDVRVEQRIATMKPSDGRFGGVIGTHSEFSFLLRVDFENKEALAHYYSHHRHSVERERLYIRLYPKIAEQFKTLHEIPIK